MLDEFQLNLDCSIMKVPLAHQKRFQNNEFELLSCVRHKTKIGLNLQAVLRFSNKKNQFTVSKIKRFQNSAQLTVPILVEPVTNYSRIASMTSRRTSELRPRLRRTTCCPRWRTVLAARSSESKRSSGTSVSSSMVIIDSSSSIGRD